ncbi:SMP-30/gluconolactonase/LRE family protein [Aliiglaciecola lipolytica]|uniref:Regucalcin n=1 Tax=Aliiglaciecola lipolytica E3 TaxID=1127673 RepID=K6XV72_9ALTE|nr:SMP-30/gluconolactonase/LRE family protein [Aliiglaciecola lipolytica]GAC15576.1 regucalcin [Aliiglaciecola lipolytica E3]
MSDKVIRCELTKEIKVLNQLGEGVIWDARSASIWWTDILSNRLYQWTFDDQLCVYDTPEALCSFALTSQPDCFVAAFASGFAKFWPKTQRLEWICKVESHLPNNRLNDGRTDRHGRFWSGSLRMQGNADLGSLYCLSDNQAVKHLDNIEISNALCWSRDGKTIYHADTPSREIKKAAFDLNTGQISDWQLFVKTERDAFPDGACVDANDNLWNAQWGSSSVKCYSPIGQQLISLTVPCKQPTCVTFAGQNLDYLVVTSACEGLTPLANKPSQDGNVFIYKTNMKGLAESICAM